MSPRDSLPFAGPVRSSDPVRNNARAVGSTLAAVSTGVAAGAAMTGGSLDGTVLIPATAALIACGATALAGRRRSRHRSPSPERRTRVGQVAAAAEVVSADPPSRPSPDGAPASGGIRAARPIIGYITATTYGRAAGDDGSAAIDAAAECAGWDLIEIVRDRDQCTRSLERPGLRYALERIAAGEAQALMVHDLMRLCRSIVDVGMLVQWFRDADATLIALDLELDTSTAEGQGVARILTALGASQQDRIAEGTRVGLAGVRARGGAVGRPAVSDRPELRERIAAMRAAGMTLQAIADQLNADGVPTTRGGTRWRPSSVQSGLGYRPPRSSAKAHQLPDPVPPRESTP
jgi:DNA invertase Pin-like site-specific DNA recombinase